MEPTEVVDSLRGLVAVADNAFRSTYDFAKDKIDPFMDIKRRDEIRRVATEIQDLAGLLHRLTLVASTFDEDHNQVLDDVYGLRSPKLPQQLFSCRQTLIKLEASLSRRKLTYDVIKQEEDLKSRAKLRWPFTTAWTVDLVQEIGQHKEAVTRALSSNSMNELLQSFSKGKDRHSSNRREVIRRYVMGRCRYSKENSTVTSFFARVDHLEVLTRTVSERTNWTDSHLWITGGPGAGKTTFAATLIETAIHTHYPDQATAVIFAFCRFSDPRSHECFYFLSTLLAQVAVQHPSAMTILGNYYSELRTRRLVEIPTIERMKAAFFAMTKAFRQILCVIDGADECSDEGDSVTQLMASLASESGNVRLAMVSRYRQGIETTLKGSFGESLCCKEFEPDRKQLEMFAATEIEKMATGANSVFHNLRLKDHIIQSFGSITNPSFRFASCSIEYIARYATTESFHEMSKTLPQNLDAIYKLTLQRWNEQRASTQALIQSALQLTAFSDPPLTSHELCQALSVAGIPGLDADELEYPEVDENEIMDACGIFLTKSTHGEEFGLAHHTVKEFLEQIDPTDSEFAGYRLSESRSRRLLGICALRFLCLNHFSRLPKRLNSEDSFLSNRRRRLPFYRYAALVWPRLADELWDDEEFRQKAMELCNPAQISNFKAWSLEACHFYRLGGSWNGWVNDRFEDKPWGVGTHYWPNRRYDSSDSLCSESTEACTGPSGSHWGTSKSSASSESSGSEETIEALKSRSWLWRQREHPDWKWQEGQTRRLAHFIRRGDFTPLHMACLLGLNRLCDTLLADQSDVHRMSRIGSPLQCALGGSFLIACHDLSTRKTYRTWNRISAVEKPSIELLQTLIEAGADCTRPLPAQYSWNSMGALGLKSSEWAGNYRIFAAMVKGGAQMHDDAIHTFRLRCREWTKYKKEQARLDVATILEILGDMVLQGEAEASAYLTAFRHVVTDMHDIDVPLPALEAVTDDMLVERMKKAIESDSLSALKETGQTPRGQLVLQDDTLDGLLDHAMSNLAANCLSFLLDRFSGSESENVKMGRLLLRCTKNEFEDVLVSLLKHGPKATTTDREGRNIWHLSTVGCESGRILQVLMSTHVGKEDREIALHALDNINGRTPLANALFTGYPDYHEASIILKRCQASKDMLQSARPSVNAIIAGIESSKTLQELHNRGILPVPGDETPLHDLQPNVNIDAVKQLVAIYSYQDSLKWKSPVGCYLSSSSFSTYKEDVLRLLISTELPLSLGPHQRSIWSMVIDHLIEVLAKPPPSGVQWASALVDILVDTGCLANHETVSGISALREVKTLLSSDVPESPRIKSELVMILDNIFGSVIDATTDHSDLKGTGLDLQLLHWAVVHDSVYLDIGKDTSEDRQSSN
ncbi:ankyrin-2 ankyrin [Colletotrichum asianum]